MVRDSQHIEDAVRCLADPIVRALALDLVDVVCSGQGRRMMVRVYIDKPGGVTVDDCEQVHTSLGHSLDIEDPISHPYILEVSSPGLDRPFKQRADYERAVGKRVRIKLCPSLRDQGPVQGTLLSVDDSGLTLGINRAKQHTTIRLEWQQVAEAKQEIEFRR